MTQSPGYLSATHAARTSHVPALSLVGEKLLLHRLTLGRRRRYSQAQIPELVAYANPRSRQAAQGFGSFALYAFRFPLKSMSPLQAFKRIASSFVGLLNAATSHTRPGPEPNAATRGLTNQRFSLTTKFSPGGCRNL
jgi:hypothetical protein